MSQTDFSPAQIRELPIEEKIEYFRNILTDPEQARNEVDALNIYRLVNSYNTFDEDFFNNESSYITDISEFIDIKTALEEDIDGLIQELVTWYLSVLYSCEIPITIAVRDADAVMPPLIYAIFTLCSLPLMASLMHKADLGQAIQNLRQVKNGFMLASKLFNEQAIVGNFIEVM